jgi:hypothetical protein
MAAITTLAAKQLARYVTEPRGYRKKKNLMCSKTAVRGK